MDKDKITAKWAREKSQEILGIKVQAELDGILVRIAEAVSNNKMLISSNSISEIVKKELTSRGFSIKYVPGYDQRDPSYYTINW